MDLSKVLKNLIFLEEIRDNQNCIKKKTQNPDSSAIPNAVFVVLSTLEYFIHHY